MKPTQPEGTKPADARATTPARTETAPAALAGALPAWDLLPDAPVRRK
jgi:hypothetical protein